MRILVFTDTHGSIEALNEVEYKGRSADLLLFCGDLTIFGQGLDKMLRRLNGFQKPILLIHGNHETEEEMKLGTRGLDNLTFLHKKVLKVDDVLIIGYGGGGFSRTFPDFNDLELEMKKFSDMPLKKIFITHAPPYRTRLDLIDGGHHGNETIARFIRRHGIDYHFSGHFHENEDAEDMLDSAFLKNPGPRGYMLEISP